MKEKKNYLIVIAIFIIAIICSIYFSQHTSIIKGPNYSNIPPASIKIKLSAPKGVPIKADGKGTNFEIPYPDLNEKVFLIVDNTASIPVNLTIDSNGTTLSIESNSFWGETYNYSTNPSKHVLIQNPNAPEDASFCILANYNGSTVFGAQQNVLPENTAVLQDFTSLFPGIYYVIEINTIGLAKISVSSDLTTSSGGHEISVPKDYQITKHKVLVLWVDAGTTVKYSIKNKTGSSPITLDVYTVRPSAVSSPPCP